MEGIVPCATHIDSIRSLLRVGHICSRQIDAAPMAAGEAPAQTRLFLLTEYANIGGIFYAYLNRYELYMADDAEVRALRAS